MTVALRTVRKVVATTLSVGYRAATSPIIVRKLAESSSPRSDPVPGTSHPRQAVKSSSFPSMTSTSGASRRFTSCAAACPPAACHRLGR
ncbi:MAG TPA: hypothetical protein VFB06_20995 [Streptosporangiaceae bacterium]|nr:hypothetical protein [Streptosporangiaceae bacterium]